MDIDGQIAREEAKLKLIKQKIEHFMYRLIPLLCPCLYLAQLLLLLDKCYGSHLDPKAQINLAYNIPLHDREE